MDFIFSKARSLDVNVQFKLNTCNLPIFRGLTSKIICMLNRRQEDMTMNNSFSFSLHENSPSWLEAYYHQINDSAAIKRRLQMEREKHPFNKAGDTSFSQKNYDNSGKHYLNSYKNTFSNQQSHPMSYENNCNYLQKDMLNQVRMKKKK